MKNKITSYILVLIVLLLFLGSVGVISTETTNGKVVYKVGLPVYVIYDTRGSPRLVIGNILAVSTVLGFFVFVSGYLYADSKNDKKRRGQVSRGNGVTSQQSTSTTNPPPRDAAGSGRSEP